MESRFWIVVVKLGSDVIFRFWIVVVKLGSDVIFRTEIEFYKKKIYSYYAHVTVMKVFYNLLNQNNQHTFNLTFYRAFVLLFQ